MNLIEKYKKALCEVLETLRKGESTDEAMLTIYTALGGAEYLAVVKSLDFERVELLPCEAMWLCDELRKKQM